MNKEINEMTLEDVSVRMSEIEAELETKSGDELVALKEEVKALQERKTVLKDLEERQALAQEIEENKAVTAKVVEERKEETKMKDIKEFRNSTEYMDAYAEYIKSGDDTELRTLLTTNVGSGTIAVPSIIEDGIKTAWEESEILQYVKKIPFKGNYKVQFEVSGSDAVIHYEGSGAVDEETLTIGTVEIIPRTIKKWISVTDEIVDLRGEDFLNYIKDELTYKIVRKAESILLNAIDALPTTADATHPSVKTVKSAPTGYVIADAIGNLCADVRGNNTVIVMNPLTFKEFRKVQVQANYAYDVFEGKKVVFSDDIAAYDTASENDTYAIVGDFSYGARAVVPNGDRVEIKYDDKTRMKSDLVDILGREPIGLGVVACKSFVRLTKPASL